MLDVGCLAKSGKSSLPSPSSAFRGSLADVIRVKASATAIHVDEVEIEVDEVEVVSILILVPFRLGISTTMSHRGGADVVTHYSDSRL